MAESVPVGAVPREFGLVGSGVLSKLTSLEYSELSLTWQILPGFVRSAHHLRLRPHAAILWG